MRRKGQKDKSVVLKNIQQIVEEPTKVDEPEKEVKSVVEELVEVETKEEEEKTMKLTLVKL